MPCLQWQMDHGCKGRTANDVSPVSDPATGVAIYDSYQQNGLALCGLAGNAAQMDTAESLWQPANRQYLNGFTSGFDGNCKPKYLCATGKGYDGPTGWGT